MTHHEEIAHELHRQGYSCAQAVLAAFSDVIGLDQTVLLKIAGGLGGGVAEMREICGAVMGDMLAMGMLYAEGSNQKLRRSKYDYPQLREVADAFRKVNGSIVCRELLGLEGAKRTRPEGKTCHDMVLDAARLLDEYIEAHPIPGAEKRSGE